MAVWLNEFETAEGTKYVRSITFAPRRFRDQKTGEWRDGAYRPVDLPALQLALEAAHEFCLTTPLPGEAASPEESESLMENDVPPSEDIPF